MTQISRRSNRSTRKTSSHGDNQGRNHDDGIPNPKTRNFDRRKSGCCRITSIILFIALVIILTIALYTNMYYLVNPLNMKLVKPRAVTPLAAPKLMDLPMFAGEHKESLYWGTYRPHLYFGVRARTPQSLLAGLMWIGVKDGRYSMRHVCENSDDLKTYGWTHHNGRDYGRQILVDQEFTLTTSFLKSKDKNSGYGGDWAVRIEAQSELLHEESPQVVHLFFYMADESGTDISLGGATSDNTDHHLLAFGSRTDVGDWGLHLESKDDFEFHYAGFLTSHFHNLSDLVLVNLGTQINKLGRLQLSDSSDRVPNVLVFQISAVIPFRADVAFVSKGSSSETEERAKSLSGESLTGLLEQKLKDFDDKFRSCFNMSDELVPQANTVAKAALGNLLGGIGYFYGQSKISMPPVRNLDPVDNYVSYWSAELYTAVPSRPFFPRGFLWDEGFHQLLIRRWDVRISLDIIGHWLDLMNADGWIPREQILGAEALSKVPAEFVLQHPTNGNPPTLFLVLRDLVSGLKKNKFTASERNDISIFLRQAFVRLDAWFQWFNTTQAGKVTNTYFWHGRDNSTIRELNPKSLSSGLDDYPRASHPSEDERHVDLRCWMHLAAECMSSVADVLDDNHIGEEYRLKAKALSDFQHLNQMHLDSSSGVYFDYGNHTEKVQLSWRLVEAPGNYPKRELVREVQEKPVLRLVPHVGYVSLFPFMERLIPSDSWILEKQLDLISNTSALWTKYGLRSLSRTSSLYMQRNTEHDPPYWRGPIWMNMNYMILSALNHYAKVDGPYRDQAKVIYKDLRNNLISNVVKIYNQTGFLWEQYDQRNGKGKGTRSFTGWTSLIVLVMAQAYHD